MHCHRMERGKVVDNEANKVKKVYTVRYGYHPRNSQLTLSFGHPSL
jgi:hypothetical protein